MKGRIEDSESSLNRAVLRSDQVGEEEIMGVQEQKHGAETSMQSKTIMNQHQNYGGVGLSAPIPGMEVLGQPLLRWEQTEGRSGTNPDVASGSCEERSHEDHSSDSIEEFLSEGALVSLDSVQTYVDLRSGAVRTSIQVSAEDEGMVVKHEAEWLTQFVQARKYK